MTQTITALAAGAKLYTLPSQVNTGRSTVSTTGKSVLASAGWNAVMGTVALLAVPGLLEVINPGRGEPTDATP